MEKAKLGDRLENGAVIIAIRNSTFLNSNDEVILCLKPFNKEYVTWIYSMGNTFRGHYTLDFNDAVDDFNKRT